MTNTHHAIPRKSVTGQRVTDRLEQIGALHVAVVVNVHIQHQRRLPGELQQALQGKLLLLRPVASPIQHPQVHTGMKHTTVHTTNTNRVEQRKQVRKEK